MFPKPSEANGMYKADFKYKLLSLDNLDVWLYVVFTSR